MSMEMTNADVNNNVHEPTNTNTNTNTSILPYPPIHKDAKFVVLSDCMCNAYHSVSSRRLRVSGYGSDCGLTSGSLIVKGTVRLCSNENNAMRNDRYVMFGTHSRTPGTITLFDSNGGFSPTSQPITLQKKEF